MGKSIFGDLPGGDEEPSILGYGSLGGYANPWDLVPPIIANQGFLPTITGVPGLPTSINLPSAENILRNNPLLQNELLQSGVTGMSDVFFDFVNIAEQNKVPLTQAEFTDLVARANAATSNEEISQILTGAGIFHDAATLDSETGMDMGGRLMDRVTITDASSSAETDSEAADEAAGATSTADPTAETDSYSWIYEDGGFVYAPYDVNGNRLPGGERLDVSDVAGTENKTFQEGDSVSILVLPDGPVLEHGGATTDEPTVTTVVTGDDVSAVDGTDTDDNIGNGTATGNGTGNGTRTGTGTDTGTGTGIPTPTETETPTPTDTGIPTSTGTETDTEINGDGLIISMASQSPITEQMFSRELFEPKFRKLENVAKAVGMLQSIGRLF